MSYEPTAEELHGADEAPQQTGLNLDPFRRFLQLKADSTRLAKEKKAVDEQITALSEALPDVLMANGLETLRLDGMTIHIKDAAYAKAKDGDYTALSKELIRHGYGSLVVVGSRALNTLWTGLVKEGEEIPEWLQAVAERESNPKLQARKSKK